MPVGIYDRKRKDKVSCPECGQKYAPSFIRTHMRKTHDIRGGLSGIVRKSTTEIAAAVEVHQTNILNQRLFSEDENFIVLQADDGSIWVAEMIRGPLDAS